LRYAGNGRPHAAGLVGRQGARHGPKLDRSQRAIDHFGVTEPGESWKAVENGELERDGAIPVNPSGGLIGVGHPVGTTGLNIGGSLTTAVSFVVTRKD
jgi:hypothetical protein